MAKFKEISLLRNDGPTERLKILMRKLTIDNPEDFNLEDILTIIFGSSRKKLSDIFERTGSEIVTIAPDEIPAIKEALLKITEIASKDYKNETKPPVDKDDFDYPEEDDGVDNWLEFEL